jgi:hypothetical protein
MHIFSSVSALCVASSNRAKILALAILLYCMHVYSTFPYSSYLPLFLCFPPLSLGSQYVHGKSLRHCSIHYFQGCEDILVNSF